jgi:hypothetical protein
MKQAMGIGFPLNLEKNEKGAIGAGPETYTIIDLMNFNCLTYHITFIVVSFIG